MEFLAHTQGWRLDSAVPLPLSPSFSMSMEEPFPSNITLNWDDSINLPLTVISAPGIPHWPFPLPCSQAVPIHTLSWGLLGTCPGEGIGQSWGSETVLRVSLVSNYGKPFKALEDWPKDKGWGWGGPQDRDTGREEVHLFRELQRLPLTASKYICKGRARYFLPALSLWSILSAAERTGWTVVSLEWQRLQVLPLVQIGNREGGTWGRASRNRKVAGSISQLHWSHGRGCEQDTNILSLGEQGGVSISQILETGKQKDGGQDRWEPTQQTGQKLCSLFRTRWIVFFRGREIPHSSLRSMLIRC